MRSTVRPQLRNVTLRSAPRPARPMADLAARGRRTRIRACFLSRWRTITLRPWPVRRFHQTTTVSTLTMALSATLGGAGRRTDECRPCAPLQVAGEGEVTFVDYDDTYDLGAAAPPAKGVLSAGEDPSWQSDWRGWQRPKRPAPLGAPGGATWDWRRRWGIQTRGQDVAHLGGTHAPHHDGLLTGNFSPSPSACAPPR